MGWDGRVLRVLSVPSRRVRNPRHEAAGDVNFERAANAQSPKLRPRRGPGQSIMTGSTDKHRNLS